MEGDESVIDLAHGGSFATGGFMIALTTFGALSFWHSRRRNRRHPHIAPKGGKGDAWLHHLRGCSKGFGPVYQFEFEHFIKPSVPWQIGEAGQEALNEVI